MAKVLKLAIELEGHPEAERILANVERQLDRVEKKAKSAEASANAFEAAYIRSTRAVDALGVAHVRTRLDETFGLVERQTKSAAASASIFQREYSRASRELDQFSAVLVQVPPALDRATFAKGRLITASAGLSNAMMALSAGSAPGPMTIAMLGRLAATGGPTAAALVGVGAAISTTTGILVASIKEYVTASGILEDHRQHLDGVSKAWRDFKLIVGEAVVGRGTIVSGELDLMATAIRVFGVVVATEAAKIAGPWRALLGLGPTGAHAHMGAFPGADINLPGQASAFFGGPLSARVQQLWRGEQDPATQRAIDQMLERVKPRKPLAAESFLPSGSMGLWEIPQAQATDWAAQLEDQYREQNEAFLRAQQELVDENTRIIDEMAQETTMAHGRMTDEMAGQWDTYGAKAQQVIEFVGAMSRAHIDAFYQSLSRAGIFVTSGLGGEPGSLARQGLMMSGISAGGFGGMPAVPLPSLPSFQHGGLIDAGAGTPAMLHGRELITPLDRPGAGLVTVNLTINAQPGQSPHAIADVVIARIEQRLARLLPGRV